MPVEQVNFGAHRSARRRVNVPGHGTEGMTSMQRKRIPPEQRFWAKVDKTGDCWVWTAGTYPSGYGMFHLKTNPPYRPVPAHRWAYEQAVGLVPEGLELDHLCRTRRCVNPAHLEAVTHRENCLRGISPAAYNARKKHCDAGHELAGRNLYVDPDGHRQCKRCRADAVTAIRHRRDPKLAERLAAAAEAKAAQIAEVRRLRAEGVPVMTIMSRVGFSRNTVYKYLREGRKAA